jgi:hypothetical protein
MATQYPGTDRSFTQIIQGGAPDYKYYTQIRKIKTGITVYPGNLVSGNGETEGEVDLAASGDGPASFIEVILHRVGAKAQDIDTSIAAGSYVETLRPAGCRFIVALTRADESNNTELGEPMALEATGHIKKFAYNDTNVSTDTCIDAPNWMRCAEVTTDVAATDLVQLVWW